MIFVHFTIISQPNYSKKIIRKQAFQFFQIFHFCFLVMVDCLFILAQLFLLHVLSQLFHQRLFSKITNERTLIYLSNYAAFKVLKVIMRGLYRDFKIIFLSFISIAWLSWITLQYCLWLFENSSKFFSVKDHRRTHILINGIGLSFSSLNYHNLTLLSEFTDIFDVGLEFRLTWHWLLIFQNGFLIW
jgi:hypothetical protein